MLWLISWWHLLLSQLDFVLQNIQHLIIQKAFIQSGIIIGLKNNILYFIQTSVGITHKNSAISVFTLQAYLCVAIVCVGLRPCDQLNTMMQTQKKRWFHWCHYRCFVQYGVYLQKTVLNIMTALSEKIIIINKIMMCFVAFWL